MKTKVLLWLSVFFILIVAVQASFSDNIMLYYTGDDADISGSVYIDSLNRANGTINGAVSWGNVSKINNGVNATTRSSGNNITFADSPYFDTYLLANFTFNAWVRPEGTVANSWILAKDKQTGPARSYSWGLFSTGKTWFQPAGAACTITETAGAQNNTWSMLTIVKWANNTYETYLNGAKNGAGDCDPIADTTAEPILFVKSYGADSPFQGGVDEIGIWNRSMAPNEIGTGTFSLYNNGAGFQYPFIASTQIIITAVDDFNTTAISEFSLNITWDNSTEETYNTVNGTFIFTDVGDSDRTINLTIWNATDYYPLTLYDRTITANSTNSIQANIFQAQICFNATSIVSGDSVLLNNMTIGSKTKTVSPFCFNITADTHNVLAQKTGWFNKNQTVIVTALTNTTQTITEVYSSIANVSVYQSNGTILASYGINITSITYPSWTGETGSTTNGSYYFNGINGTYQATINSSLGTETFNFTITAARQNFSYYYFTITNCSPMGQVVLNFTVRNEDTDALINNSAFNAWFNITSSLFIGQRLFNITYASGNYYLICIPNNTITNFTANAQIKYSNLATYVEKNYYLWDYPLYNSPTTNINLYLTNATTQVKLQVRDYADDGITEVYIKVLSYDLGTNSYKTTEIVKTDSEGDAYAQLVLDTYWYAFILEKDGEIIQQTSPTKITSSPRTFRVITGADYFDSYDVIQGITHSLTYNNATTTFSLTYSDPTGGITQGCIRLTKRSINGDTVLNTSCVTSTAATILMNISDGSVGTNTYIADAYAIISGEIFSLNSTSVNFNTTYKKFGANGLFLSMLLIIVLVMVGIWHPAVAIIMMLLGVVITNVMGLFFLNWTYIITFIILGVLTAYRTSKSD